MAPTRPGHSTIRARKVGSCASYAFGDSLSRANLAFTAIFILGGLVVFVAYLVLAARKGSVRRAAPWYLFGIGIFFWTLSWVFSLASTVVQECGATSFYDDVTTILNLGISLIWIYMVAMVLFLATALFPVCAQLYRNQNSTSFRTLKWIHALILLVFGALYIASTAYYTWIAETPDYDDSYSSYYSYIDNRLATWYRLSAARQIFQAIAAVMAGATMIGAWNLSRRMGSRATGLLIWTIVFTLSLLVDSIGSFGLLVANLISYLSIADTTLSPTGQFAAYTVFNLLELIAWAALLAIANSQAIGQEGTSSQPYQYAPAPFHAGQGAPEVVNTAYQPHTGYGQQQTSYDSAGPRQDYQRQEDTQNRHSTGFPPASPPMGQQQHYQAYAPQPQQGY